MSGVALLIGHRGVGKTTTGEAMRSLGWRVFDVDAEVQAATGKTPAAIIAEAEEVFRTLEGQHLARLIAEARASDAPEPALIVVGAGCMPLPDGVLCAWLRRDGWEEAARTERARLRPELSFDEEVAWMRATREPRWAASAHVALDTSRGRTPERAAWHLDRLLRWLLQLTPNTPGTHRKTWLVPSAHHQLHRGALDVALLGLAGLEIRSDLPVDTGASARLPGVTSGLYGYFGALHLPRPPIMASLRHDDARWLLSHKLAAALDLDVQAVPGVLRYGALDALDPRPLIISAHPADADPRALDALEAAAQAVAEAHPAWAAHLTLKYAPQVPSARSLQELLPEALARYARHERFTFLPQGDRFAWLRAVLAPRQATSYMPVGLAARRLPIRADGVMPTPWDLQDWAPHLALPNPARFDGLLGDPVAQSVGDVWHRAASLDEGDLERGYLKVPLPGDASDDEIIATLELLAACHVRGLSVTAPHKRRWAAIPSVHTTLDAANTLTRAPQGWTATDTDADGMRATLDHLSALGVAPGDVAVLGQGGVSDAVVRGIDASPGWRVVCHASARQGWPADAPERARVVINAAGGHGAALMSSAPACDAWVDLHYQEVAAPPPETLHLNGDIFFDAQAAAQRTRWRAASPAPQTHQEP